MSTVDIRKYATLARIDLTSDEVGGLEKNIESILGYVKQIQQLEISSSKEEGVRNVIRDDTNPHESGAYTDDLLKGAPRSKNGYVVVKKIL